LPIRVENEFGDGLNWDVVIEYSRETQPRGTAGAVKLAQSHLEDDSDFLVMNRDSFLELDFRELLQFHRLHGGLVTIAVVSIENAGRYGTVRVDSDDRVTPFWRRPEANSPD
jgi:mannose-1-phosphate guanylyltransferase